MRASEGLNAADYPVPDFTAATTPDQLAEAELKLTASMLDYARQAQSGRMHWSQVSATTSSYPEHPTDPAEVLANVTTAKDASGGARGLQPAAQALSRIEGQACRTARPGRRTGDSDRRRTGACIQGRRTKKQPAVAPEDARVPQLRAKLGITENADDTRYDAKVAEAVRKFQDGAELKRRPVCSTTVPSRPSNSPKRDRQIDTVIVNMERWRWLPRQLGAPSLGDAYVILNIPDFTLKVMQNGAPGLDHQGGRLESLAVHATPLLTETMKFITVNPTWNVPPSIIYNEYLPALQQDPTVLQRMGLRLEHARDGSIHISQPPGEANALGRIRFNFPNKFLVYQHDTPDKHLFAKEERAFSHGCMRVQNPDQYAAIAAQHRRCRTSATRRKDPQHVRPQRDRHQIPDADSGQHHLPDARLWTTPASCKSARIIYGRDAAMLALLQNTDNKDLENVVARAQPSYASAWPSLPAGVNVASDNTYYGASSGTLVL